MQQIILPQRDDRGEYYLSYSQFESWSSKKSFNLGVEGRIEYMTTYFFRERHPDAGWGQFGSEVEDYICERKWAENFTDGEKEVMDQVVPLGVFQEEIKWYILPGVYIKGYIDDRLEDYSKIRDYKTASANSVKKYLKPDYKQLDIYAGYVESITGKIPEAEVCAILRKGNCMGMINRRDLLTVAPGTEPLYIPREVPKERIEKVKAELISTVYEISGFYQHFLNLNK
jgi:hypothetical protein